MFSTPVLRTGKMSSDRSYKNVINAAVIWCDIPWWMATLKTVNKRQQSSFPDNLSWTSATRGKDVQPKMPTPQYRITGRGPPQLWTSILIYVKTPQNVLLIQRLQIPQYRWRLILKRTQTISHLKKTGGETRAIIEKLFFDGHRITITFIIESWLGNHYFLARRANASKVTWSMVGSEVSERHFRHEGYNYSLFIF